MADDIKLKLDMQVDDQELEGMKKTLEDIKKLSNSIQLNPKAKTRFDAASKSADVALEGELTPVKLKALKDSLNTLFNILGQAARTGQKISPEYENLEKELRELKERRGKLKQGTAELNARLRNKEYNSAEAVSMLEIGRKSFGKDPFGEKASSEVVQNFMKLKEEIGDLRKLSNDWLSEHSQYGFTNIQQVRDVGKAVNAGAEKTKLKNEQEQTQITKQITDIEKKLKTMSPVLEKDNTALEEFLRKLYKIQGIAGEQVSNLSPKGDESPNGSGSSGGTGGTKGTTSFDTDEVGELTKSLDKQSTTLGKVFKQFTIYNIALRSVKKALREAIKTVKDLDKALTEQAMVTGLTRKQTYGLLSDYQNIAKNLGATTKEVSSTMTAFLRQGRSIKESTELTEAAVAAAKVASISTADSVNYLTTAVNGFRLSAEDAMKVSDKFAAVAAQAATSYEEIAIAMSKVASQANLAGMSIDYTTALLTKGLETTREAPETIGTALKTVVARMREITDYGATLEDGMNINNVEKQLAYVDIELRNQNGELRSTEDVLNELGKKWDTLTSNQQAAIAKALAGTRQQSRLIAMMQDYERVIELQEIAERSQGATMAQMETYLEGMDAALNRVNNAWEKIVSTITESDIIIGLVDTFGKLLDNVQSFLDTSFGMITLMTTIAVISATVAGNKLRELQISKLQQKYTIQKSLLEAKDAILEQKNTVQKKKNLILEYEETKLKLQQYKIEKAATEQAIVKAKAEGKNTAILDKQSKEIDEQIAKAELFLNTQKTKYEQYKQEITFDEQRLQILQGQETLLKSQSSWVSNIASGFTGMITPLIFIGSLIKGLIVKTKAYSAAQRQAAGATSATSVAANPYWGWAAALAILAAVGLSIAVSAGAFNQNSNSAKKAEDAVNDLSSSIYNLSKKSDTINSTIKKFDTLDNKVIKTKEDLDEMNSMLESVADSLSEEEKEEYQSLQTNKKRREFLEQTKEKATSELEQQRIKQLKILNNLTLTEIEQSTSLSDALYALNNSRMYKVVDSLKLNEELTTATRRLTEAMLEEMTVEQQKNLLTTSGEKTLNKYVQVMSKLASTLEDDEITLEKQVRAYQEAYSALDNKEAKDAFEQANSQWLRLGEMSSTTLNYIDEHYSNYITGLNEMSSAIQKFGYSSEEAFNSLKDLTEEMAQGSSLGDSISKIFGFTEGSEDWKTLLNTYDKVFNSTISNISQNLKSFKTQIDSFYDKAGSWNTMSASDKINFIAENEDLFAGESGVRLRKALETGDYAAMQAALSSNEALLKDRQRRLNEINDKLNYQTSCAVEDRNEALIKELEEQKKLLEQGNDIFLASLETRLKKEDEELKAYKDYLQKQQEALQDSLDKRKDAYQKYFDTINQESEDEDYEEQAQLLMTNLQKLSSSNSATSEQKTKELENQLAELEKERLQTLRERAQEQVMSNIDTEVEQINEKFDKLLNSSQLLLEAMLSDTSNMEDFAASYLSTTLAGATALQAEDAINTFQTTFGRYFNGLGDISVREDENGNVIINIGGEEINLTASEGKDIVAEVMRALRQSNQNVGIGR